ncbi:hypothetical protein OPS25_07205 [Alteromonas ponticola]|uniref:Uncharacterized protein n=1 Tax=Alteromonas aquimaris TaxID=2998417 RepID=A0ABT3P687_9ALTE|nr:hypothetical protein [Alteromonas aquimaris]MCW8108279.1 hypothetical protein [Alteromonas aquimaris]
MKLLEYDFHFGAQLAQEGKPEENPYTGTVLAMTYYLGIFAIGLLFRLAMEFDVWGWMMENWPYEYGRVHSKNIAAPTGVLAIILFLALRYSLRKYFLRQEVINRLQQEFEIDDPDLRIHSFLPRFLLFFFMFYGVMIAGAYWVVVGFCTAIVIALELWVRYRFFWNRETLLQQPYAQKVVAEREKVKKKKRK